MAIQRDTENGKINRLIELLASICPLTDAFGQALKKELTLLSLPKNYHLLEAPRVSDHAYFLSSGFAMTYTFDAGKKVVERFWRAEQIIVSVKSFFGQLPSSEFIQLLEPSDVFFIRHDAVVKMLVKFPEADVIYRTVIGEYFDLYRQKVRDLYELNALKRYELLTRDYPQIEQIVAQEYIASYLGITPQSLSRLKARRLRG